MGKIEFLNSDDAFSYEREYRYWLWFEFNKELPPINFLMLNPSTAKRYETDPTVAKTISFADKWKFGSVHVTNLFGLCATDPKVMKLYHAPVGEDNIDYIKNTAKTVTKRGGKIVLAYGNDGKHINQDEKVMKAIREILPNVKFYCLGRNKNGTPLHPLYVKLTTRLKEYK